MRRPGEYAGHRRPIHAEENEQMEEELKSKVSTLRSLTINIGEEVRDQNKFLRGMDEDMDKVGGLLGSTMGRLKQISRSGYGKMYCYLFLFSMGVFFVMYWILRLR